MVTDFNKQAASGVPQPTRTGSSTTPLFQGGSPAAKPKPPAGGGRSSFLSPIQDAFNNSFGGLFGGNKNLLTTAGTGNVGLRAGLPSGRQR